MENSIDKLLKKSEKVNEVIKSDETKNELLEVNNEKITTEVYNNLTELSDDAKKKLKIIGDFAEIAQDPRIIAAYTTLLKVSSDIESKKLDTIKSSKQPAPTNAIQVNIGRDNSEGYTTNTILENLEKTENHEY